MGPLGMADTGIALCTSMQERMATGHTAMLAPAANWDLSTLAGAGVLRSSANDMLTFLEDGELRVSLLSVAATGSHIRLSVGR
jgi:CubicO group peptidase (beta-lactamase class C family)